MTKGEFLPIGIYPRTYGAVLTMHSLYIDRQKSFQNRSMPRYPNVLLSVRHAKNNMGYSNNIFMQWGETRFMDTN